LHLVRVIALLLAGLATFVSHAQVAPTPADKAAYTGILAAAARGDATEIRALVAKGTKPDVRDGYRRTPLHVAAYGGHHEAMRALVAAGANPNALVAGGANVNLADRNGQTPLTLARRRGYAEMVRMLERAGAR
jgi:ankyrin repeat protein